MLKRLYILIAIAVITIVPCFSEAHDSSNIIRVGISNNNFSKYIFDSAEFTATGDYEIIDIPSGKMVSGLKNEDVIKITIQNGCYSIYQNNNLKMANLKGPLVLKTRVNTNFLSVYGLKRAGKTALYRGVFELTKRSGNENAFCIVNVLDLENYLKGVVPNEMPVAFGLEALKAQTIAARNYALKPRERFYSEFDVCDSVASQVYFGAATEKELSNLAIKQTNGLVALSPKEDLIMALYSSTAGGYTESYEYAFSEPKTKEFPARSVPYLKAKPDSTSIKPLSNEADAKAFYLSYPDSYDSQSPYFRWEREWNFEELEQVLKRTLVEQSKVGFVKPILNDAKDFGTLVDIKVNKRGESGKIISLNIITDKDIFCVSKELVIRRTFQKNGKALPSANFVIDNVITPSGKKIILHGGGFGHGVGMSQFGAGGMAQRGFKFDEILQHYYSGISITTMPVSITNQNSQNSADQVFFAPYKKAILCIDDKDNVNDLTVIINDKEFKPDLDNNSKRKYRIDISEYINIGQNTIVYCVPAGENRKKTMRVYVELKEAANDD